ncbi:hypothetical protein [Sulfitobacter sp. TBRI5]|uniref:hypothetical protein n=1 Tax=Sulfitobacter sp. TBRI5 TaxID=2989732 RepID=UPI003D9B9774
MMELISGRNQRSSPMEDSLVLSKFFAVIFVILAVFASQAVAQSPLRTFLDICACEANTASEAAAAFEFQAWSAPQASEVKIATAYLAIGELILRFSARKGLDMPQQAALEEQKRAVQFYSRESPDGVYALLDPTGAALVMIWSQPISEKLSCALYTNTSAEALSLMDFLTDIGGQEELKLTRTAWKMFKEPTLGYTNVSVQIAAFREHAAVVALGYLPEVDMAARVIRLSD